MKYFRACATPILLNFSYFKKILKLELAIVVIIVNTSYLYVLSVSWFFLPILSKIEEEERKIFLEIGGYETRDWKVDFKM